MVVKWLCTRSLFVLVSIVIVTPPYHSFAESVNIW